MDYWFSAHEVAQLAAEIESKGAVFYRHLQDVADDATIADMCAFFVAQEDEHHTKFLAIAEAYRTSECEQWYSVDIGEMLKASISDMAQFCDGENLAARSLATVSECLSLAARLEATAIRVYTQMGEKYTARFSGILSEVLEEEQKHLRMIQHVQKRIQPAVT